MEQERIRIRDIADELGLSTATVSNVIHGKGKASEATVRRVQALLEERRYIPSMAGILLAQNASRIIGVFLNDHEKYEGHTLEDEFIASSLNCLSSEIERQEHFMMVKTARNPQEIIQFASMWNMDGIVVIGFCAQDYAYLRGHMRIPFVVYDGFCDKTDRFLNITIDNFDGGRQVGELFRRCGRKRALCVSDNRTGVDRERYEGFRAGFAPGSVELLLIPMLKRERYEFYRENLGKMKNVTGIFAVSDHYAIELLHFLQESGLSVPEEISIAGFDDISLCEMVFPTLTTVRQDGAARARLAVSMLRELREGTARETAVTLPVTLVEREST